MFESIRNHQRALQLALVVLIFPAFALFGLPAYDRMTGGDAVASVDGESITMQEFEQAQQEQASRLRATLGDSFDPAMLQSPAARREIIEGLVVRRTLAAAARDAQIAITDEQLRQVIIGIPGLSDDNGRFDRERYATLLASRGMSEAGFEYEQRRELALRALPESIGLTAFAPEPMVERLLHANEEIREIAVRTFRADEFVAQTDATDEEIRAYYDENPKAFEIPESAKVEFAVLSPEVVASRVEVDAQAVRDFYEQNPDRFGEPEQRRARHILVAAGDNAGERAAAREKAQSLKASIDGGADFDTVARESSDDEASRESGGDLGLFRRDDMIEPVADAVFAIAESGTVAGPVESEFGWHIVRLDAIQPAQRKPFDEVRPQIESELREQRARLRFGEAAEDFSNIVYEQGDSLAPVNEQLGIEIQVADNVRRGGADNPESPLNHPAVLRALFTPDSLSRRQNTEAIEIGNSRLVAARVVEHRPARVPPLDEVRDDVAQRVKTQKAARLAREAGEAALARLREAPESAEGFSEPQTVSRIGAASLGAETVRAVFSADTSTLPAHVGVPQGERAYAIFRIVGAAAPDEAKIAERITAYRDQAADVYGQAEAAAYFELLRRDADVEVHLDRVTPASGDDG